MTESMMEKLARAWHDRDPTSRPVGFERAYSLLTKEKKAVLIGNARALLLALREPDEGMILAAKGCRDSIVEDANTKRTFTAMIDHILNDNGPSREDRE
jgi:hypothetical protein